METYRIDLKNLKDDETRFCYEIDDSFFHSLDGAQLDSGRLNVDLTVRKAPGFFDLHFCISGVVHVPCDLCLDPVEQPIQTDNRVVAKLGETPSEDDEQIVVSETDAVLNVSWLIYEFIVLSVPIKHVHAPGKCNAAMTKKLHELSAARSSDETDESVIDPRWNALSKLKDKNKQ